MWNATVTSDRFTIASVRPNRSERPLGSMLGTWADLLIAKILGAIDRLDRAEPKRCMPAGLDTTRDSRA